MTKRVVDLPSPHYVPCMIALGLLVVAVLCQLPRTALAQAGQLTPSPWRPAEEERPPDLQPQAATPQWYGWQTIVADVGAIGVTSLGFAIATIGGGSDWGWAVAGLGLAVYVLSAPILHLTHDNQWALGSALLRVAAVGLLVGGVVDISRCAADKPCWGGAMAFAGFIFAAAMPVVDAVLAVEPPPQQSRMGFAPWLGPRADVAGVTLFGRL